MEDEFVASSKPKRRGPKRPTGGGWALLMGWGVLALIVVGVLSFLGGMNYQKHHQTTAVSTNGFNGSGFGGGFGGGMRRTGGLGTVTAVSSSSISVKNSRTGTTKTYDITSSTTVTNNGSSAAVSDIKVGDTVLVRADSSNTSQAASIDLNPSFGGNGPMGAPTDDSGGTTTNPQST